MNPEYPVYIISKGRWEQRKTSKTLERLKVPYKIVVEPQEYDEYAAVIKRSKILVLPFSGLGQGSIPARNWVWEHSISIDAKKHWILDDNIFGFERINRNRESRVTSGTIFKCAEDFVNRYKNIGMSGFNYDYFVALSQAYPPYYLNSRIYSCILIKNKIPFRWRGRYNEDTDLSIRVLKSGLCTILFNAFVACKTPTGVDTGGNADELYKDDGRLKMAQSLAEQHPEIVKVTWKYNRWQHQVYYRHFKKNRLVKKKRFKGITGINNYGMKLIIKDHWKEKESG
ncbi:MAG TPA: hypothetical protein VMX17_01230 [Candidatus Glassbacteria bacterium]|nr:hypothetical protein [Candidatus Glassbacteria bacterium]